MTPLKLAALDAEDLQVISAHCQDAVVRVGDIEFHPGARDLVLAINRFAWEAPSGSFFRRRPNQRHRAALHFGRVEAARTAGIDRTRKDDVLSLLAIRFTQRDAPAGTVELVFSGDAAIQLDVECLEVRLADLGAAWETASRPTHKV